MTLDMIVRGGEVYDGSGAAPRRVDIGVRDGRIVALEANLAGEATQVIDATGRIVTPGFVDVHSHYDGQATWDDVLDPSFSHGVTTVVMGNCGVGFAPVRLENHGTLIELMEGVEDIPGTALTEGMTWGWESFPQYLDALDKRRWTMDVAAQLPHGALRHYVTRGRGDGNAEATADEIAEMARLAREAAKAGALGFSTSRTLGHHTRDGRPVPGTFAHGEELFAIGKAFAEGGGRVFEVAGAGIDRGDDPAIVKTELDWLGALAAETGLTATFIVLQHDADPTRWRAEMDRMRDWRARGAKVIPLVAARPFGVLWGWDVRHPFVGRPSYEAVAHLPLAERLVVLRKPEIRAAILGETTVYPNAAESALGVFMMATLDRCTVLVGRPDYETPPEGMLGAKAAGEGKSLEAVAYDALAQDGGMLLLSLFNYADANHDTLHKQLLDRDAVVGLSDGGAHCNAICDASIPTYMLTHWARDRHRGDRLALAECIRRITSQTADLYGFDDRGRVELGKRADLNVIDFERLDLTLPYAVNDLPAGGTRLVQGSVGYDATIVAGEVTRRHGKDTGARPGRLVRG